MDQGAQGLFLEQRQVQPCVCDGKALGQTFGGIFLVVAPSPVTARVVRVAGIELRGGAPPTRSGRGRPDGS